MRASRLVGWKWEVDMSEMWTMDVTLNHSDGRESSRKYAESTFEDHMHRLRQLKGQDHLSSMVVTLVRS
jgi:hypothetical protein